MISDEQITNKDEQFMEKKQINIVFNPHNMQVNRARKSSEQAKTDKVYYSSAQKTAHIMPLINKSAIERTQSEDTNYEKCRAFFNKYDVPTEILNKLFVECKAKAIMKEHYIEVRCHEDTWRIYPKSKSDDVDLSHNNYVRTFFGGRNFESGYHRQIITDKSLAGTLKYIMDYDYKKFHNPQKALKQSIKRGFEEEFEKGFERAFEKAFSRKGR